MDGLAPLLVPPAVTPIISRFESLMGHPHIYPAVLCWLNIMTLIHLARTNKYMHHIVDIFKKEAFSINQLLQRFFPGEAEAFRHVQAETYALISGSAALRFFERKPLDPGSDLDVYVRLRGE